ncbi:MAG TPA: TadE/TadG family type IV pilus assembly protein [Actinomycetota bacterium]|nr:TadE/TadG family type IV pilus assembly protein [Actinomycetota bacterium]
MTVHRIRDEEAGAEMVEMAVALPVLLLLVLGIVYALLTTAAFLSLNHAANVGARFASIPTDPVHGVYPTDAEVAQRIEARTPFFSADACTTSVSGETGANDPLTLELDCPFPNPFGRVLNALGATGSGGEGTGPHHEGDLVLSVSARARRE